MSRRIIFFEISSVPLASEGINEGINRLLDYIGNTPGTRTPQLASHLEFPIKTMERWLAELKRKGLIEHRGSKKTGGYYKIS
jgi:ATP-dependent DNA helicase RecG